MKYGIFLSSTCKAQTFPEWSDARASFALARETLRDGESVSFFSESPTGTRVTLAHVYQPRMMSLDCLAAA